MSYKLQPQSYSQRAFLSLIGVALFLSSAILLIRLMQGAFNLHPFIAFLLGVAYIFLLSTGATMSLFVISEIPIIRKISRITLFPAEVIAKLGYYWSAFTAPLYIFFGSGVYSNDEAGTEWKK